MTNPIPADMLKQLRHLLASAISDAKAYEVPALCRRLNLGDGTAEEAFSSKYRYAQKRIAEVSPSQVIDSAKALVAEEAHFELSEQLAKISELGGPQVTTLTRRRPIALFDDRPLATDIEDIDLIRSVWPIAQMPAPIQGAGHTLEDDIIRHTIRNDDLTQRELLEALGLLTCSRHQLFKFLVAVTAPNAQTPEGQAALVPLIDDLLRKDGYTLAVAGKISGSPHYLVKPAPNGSPADESISATLAAFDSNQVHSRSFPGVCSPARQAAGPLPSCVPKAGHSRATVASCRRLNSGSAAMLKPTASRSPTAIGSILPASGDPRRVIGRRPTLS